MSDPLVGAIAVGLAGSVVAGPVVAFCLEFIPQHWRRTTEWLLIGGALVFAIVADLLSEGPGAGGVFAYVVAALPGPITFLVWRTLLASTFVSLAPMYFVIAMFARSRPTHAPELPLDRAIALEPAWMIVYGSLYVFVLILPLLVVRQRELVLRALKGYLAVMAGAYICFLVYPTSAPRPDHVLGAGFSAWSLRLAYSLDLPYNCFPSLHVAYSFVSALTCYRVHRGVGIAATIWAALIAASTLYTKQHYVVDVIVGALAAYVAYLAFLRDHSRDDVTESDRRRAPVRALIAVEIFVLMIFAFWVAYRLHA